MERHESYISVWDSGEIKGSTEILTDRRFTVHMVLGRLKITFRTVNKSPLCNLKFCPFYLLYKTLRIKHWIILHTALSYIVYKCIQLYFANERSHNKALTLIVLSVSRSCALNPLNINAVTLHMPQTLPTFPVIQFPPHLHCLVTICNSVSCTSIYNCSYTFFHTDLLRKLQFVTDRTTQTVPLTLLSLTHHYNVTT
jgi:hypothetical protein